MFLGHSDSTLVAAVCQFRFGVAWKFVWGGGAATAYMLSCHCLSGSTQLCGHSQLILRFSYGCDKKRNWREQPWRSMVNYSKYIDC
jgi:hypothetical protein